MPPLISMKAQYSSKKVSGDLGAMVRHFNQLPAHVKDATKDWLLWAGETVARQVKENITYGSGDGGGPAPEGKLKVQTGHLRRSVTVQVDSAKGIARVGTNVKYASVHEFGGTIRPKKGKFLTIPIPGALGKEARNIGKISDYKGIVFDMEENFERGGTAGIIQNDQYVPLFALKRKVEIPERAPFQKALDKKRDEIGKNLDVQLGKKIEEEYGR